jgi:5-methylcytosine-specific restriction endonuclease McrA
LNEILRKSPYYKEWRKQVFERDNYTCQECRKKGGSLNAHHLKEFADYPELRFNVSNGKTLCRDCHEETKFGKKYWERRKNVCGVL